MNRDDEKLNPAWLVAEPQQTQCTTVFIEQQQTARQYLNAHGLPTSAIEEWKYTSLRGLANIPFVWALPEEGRKVNSEKLQFLNAEYYRIVIVNGHYCGEYSRLPADQVEVVCSVERVSDTSVQTVRSGNNFTEELNSAHINEVTVINVASGSVIKTPIELVIVTDLGSNEAIATKVVFNIGSGAELKIIETHLDHRSEEPSLLSFVSEYFLSENSRVIHYKVIQKNEHQFSFVATKVLQEQASIFKQVSCFAEAALYRNELFIGLHGEGAECNLNNLTVLDREQRVDNYTIMTHQAQNCTSNQRFKGIYNGNANGVFTGTIVVQSGAQKTNAYQSNANLLLSPNAKVEARPQLKIWADDVKCTHGEACGQIDEDALFYLQARGISKKEAKKILIQSFAQEIIDLIEDAKICQTIKRVVDASLANI